MKIIIVILLLLSNIINVYAQESRKSESIEIPFSVFNKVEDSPEIFKLKYSHMANFIVSIKNELIYKENNDAKAVIRLGDSEDDKIIELMMYSTKRLIVSIFTSSTGYFKLHDSENGWFSDRAVVVSFVQNDKLSMHNGQRNIMDRLSIKEFTLDTLEVYGKDSIDSLDNTIGGRVVIDILSGNPLDNPISFMPAVVVIIVGVIIALLIKTKKR
ncbi:MAG: hypothetical protein QW416_00595 [Candidatus Nitrosocaldaceae archaeon]